MTFRELLKLAREHKRIAIAAVLFVFGVALTLAIVVAMVGHYLFGESKTEKQIDNRTAEIQLGNTATNQIAANANTAQVTANQKTEVSRQKSTVAVDKARHAQQVEANANAVRNSNVSGVSVDKATKDLCEAYPEDKLCKH